MPPSFFPSCSGLFLNPISGYSYHMAEIILHFFIYSILGYISEVVYCSVPQRRFVNRGFLYGPYLPIYGFGGMIVYLLPDAIRSNILLLFLLAFVLTSCLEYFTSWLLEKCFSVKLWDYSKHFGNINGRVCLLNSSLFGIMGVVTVNAVEPVVDDIISVIPDAVLVPLTHLIVAALSIDATLSVMKMISFRKGLEAIRQKRKEIEDRTRALVAAGKKELAEEFRARLEEDFEKTRTAFLAKASRIARSNPSMSASAEEVRRQIDVIISWTKERNDLRKRQRAEVDKLNKEKMAELKGDRK